MQEDEADGVIEVPIEAGADTDVGVEEPPPLEAADPLGGFGGAPVTMRCARTMGSLEDRILCRSEPGGTVLKWEASS